VNNNKNNPNLPLLHSPGEVGQEAVYASRSATKIGYRTTPLRALWQHPPYFHDGSAPDLLAVVNHYNSVLMLGLTDRQKQTSSSISKLCNGSRHSHRVGVSDRPT
jgi:cytochrome c peroxidase